VGAVSEKIMTKPALVSLLSLCAVGCAAPPTAKPEAPIQTSKVSPASEPDPQPVADPPPRSKSTPVAQAISCERPDTYGPVWVDPAAYASRRGAAQQKFSEIVSTKAEPIEACGVLGSVNELLRLRCDDGSNPFQTKEAAHDSRSGNVGPGGRCGSIVDLYRVPCPEKTYSVFIDMYICAGPTQAS